MPNYVLQPPVVADPQDAVRATVANIINATWSLGQEQKNEFSTKVSDLASGTLDTANAPTVSAGSITGATITEPGVNIPASADVADVLDVFDTKYLELAAWLNDRFVEFRATYFPDEQNAYVAAEDALQAALASGSFIPADVQAQIFGDDEARIIDAKLRAQDAVVGQFASRGFPLPPDVAASAVLQIEQKAQDELAESSRKVAILSVEQFRFTVDKVLALRGNAMNAAVEYIKALASGPDMASRLVNVGYDAQSKLIAAASSFYNARIDAAKTMNSVAQYNNTVALEAATKNQSAELAMISEKVKALLAEAQAIAQMATSLFNNVNAGVSISASRGASVGYSYSNDTSGTAPPVVDVG